MSATHPPTRIVEDRVETAGMFASDAMTRLHRCVCLLPLVEVIVFAFLVVRVSFLEGHWPAYGNPDPGNVPWPLDYWLSLILVPAAFASTAWVVLAMPFRRLFNADYHFWLWSAFNLAVFWSWVVLMRSDVGGLATWFID